MGPPGSVELPLAAYRAATLRSVGGVVTSRGIEPRSLGLQPSAMTTLARWSFWWSRRRESNPRLRVTRAPCLRQHFVDVVPPAGVEPAWFRLKGGRMAALPRRGTMRCKVGCRAGIRTRIFPVNSRTCCRCHHPTSERSFKLAGRRGFAVSRRCGAAHRDTADHAKRDRPPDWRGQSPRSCRWTICQWSGREESNLHAPAPEAGGLPITLRPENPGDHDEVREGVRAGLEPDLEGHYLPC